MHSLARLGFGEALESVVGQRFPFARVVDVRVPLRADVVARIEKTEQEWREELTPEEFHVLRQKGTEAPFSGEFDHSFEPGTYRCAGCGATLFESDTKYDSGYGWPAFYAPADEDSIDEETDTA